MRKDLIFRYLNSSQTNLNRVLLHLCDEKDPSTRAQRTESDNGIAKEWQSSHLSQVEIDFVLSQIESIRATLKTVEDEFRKSLKN